MEAYKNMNKAELEKIYEELKAQYDRKKSIGLKLDMSRGKPGTSQLELSTPIMDVITSKSVFKGVQGFDFRNYGVLDGISEAKKLVAELMGCSENNVIVCGNSSLALMYNLIANAMLFGIDGSTPWSRLPKIKFLCPVPGYDRHFAITEKFGFEMINIAMTENGPDMDEVERLVSSDDSIKGIWCVPKYSNPTGCVYSDETVRRFAALKPKAKDFRIFWDNAYAVHDLYEDSPELLNIVEECKKTGNEDIYYEMFSTSKISLPGSGIAAIITSEKNVAEIKKHMTVQTIGYDKINQIRHVEYFKNADGIRAHMKKHAEILKPKFEIVTSKLEKEIGGLGIGTWIYPRGGYFVAFEGMEGTATRIVNLCKEAGVVMTPAGAPFPYGKDPKDSCIRIAPTFPSESELAEACDVFTICIKLASVEKLLNI